MSMFDFLLHQHLHTVHIMYEFLAGERVTKREKEDEHHRLRVREEYEERIKRRQAEMRRQDEENLRLDEEERQNRLRRRAYTLDEFSEGTGIKKDEIREAIKAAEEYFVHWPHPEQPELTQFALREHAETMGLRGWQPGVGF